MEHGTERIGQIFDFGLLHLEWPTALFIFVVFVITMFFLNTLLFKPILRTLEGRQSEIDKNLAEKESLTNQIDASEKDYQSKLQQVREEIKTTRQNALDEALEKSRQIITKAQQSVASKLEDAEKELSNEKESALKEASALTKDLSELIKSKVLA